MGHGEPGAPRRRRRPIGCALALLIIVGAVLAYLTLLSPGRWKTYHDPVAGFSLQYPPAWLLTTDPDGSHPTFINPTTGATISAYATTLAGAPDAVLRAAVPQGAAHAQSRTIAGAPARDFAVPATQGSGGGEAGVPAPPEVRMVLVAARNSAGTTNLYTLMLTQRVSSAQASGSDAAAFETVLSQLTLASSSSWMPFVSSPATPAPIQAPERQSCDAICWADANWSATNYGDDASGRECAAYDDTASDYTQCDTYATAMPEYFQPDFQCSEFVGRALAQQGLIPGIASGGYGGAGGPGGGTGQWGGYSLNSYPFTYAGDAANGDTRYNLLGVGTAGAPGLYQYLLDSGIGVSIHQNLAAASPGDVVFFYSPSLADGNRQHVMLITSLVRYASSEQGLSGWDALLDGHNRAAYHRLLSSATGPESPFEIIHLRASRAIVGTFATSGAGWATGEDGNGLPLSYVATTSAASPTASAEVRLPGDSVCVLAVYVPNTNATAVATFTVTLADGSSATRAVDESATDGWVLLYRWNDTALRSPPVKVVVANATGTGGQSLGVGQMTALCAQPA